MKERETEIHLTKQDLDVLAEIALPQNAEPTEEELDEIELEPFDRDGWDDEAALGSAGFGMDETYEW